VIREDTTVTINTLTAIRTEVAISLELRIKLSMPRDWVRTRLLTNAAIMAA
jgi:hypothetical protein